MRFDYLDSNGDDIAPGKVEDADSDLATVKVTLGYSAKQGALTPQTISTAISLSPSSGTIDFELPNIRFRLTRIFHPLDHPAAVVSRQASDWGAVLAAGKSPSRDPAYLYTFQMEERFMGAPQVDNVVSLEDVRAPVSATFAPEGGPLAGSLFVAAWGLRIGHLSQIWPDDAGGFSAESEMVTFDGTEAIAQAGGIVFGVDDALYVTSREKGAIFRYQFDEQAAAGKPQMLFRVSATPGAIARGYGRTPILPHGAWLVR